MEKYPDAEFSVGQSTYVDSPEIFVERTINGTPLKVCTPLFWKVCSSDCPRGKECNNEPALHGVIDSNVLLEEWGKEAFEWQMLAPFKKVFENA